jgi:glycine/D-amino acid oxidase-like deaminating enzyme
MEPSDAVITRMLGEAVRRPFWLDRPEVPAPEPQASLIGHHRVDLAIVGAGFTGLWAAHQALDRQPGREVMVLEATTVADGASGRNGGFCDASVTHGVANGLAHFGDEYPDLHRMGNENLAQLLDDLARHGVDACWEPVGELDVATAPWQVQALHEHADLLTANGEDVVVLDAGAAQEEVRSPTFLGGVWRRSNVGLVDPARLAWGLARSARARGVQLIEQTPVTRLARAPQGVRLEAPGAVIDAAQVLLATNAFPGLVRAIRRSVVPVYDHVLVTEPLGADRLAELGWRNRQGLSDAGNQFHYFRLTPDDRLLWGGYDAIYHWRGRMGPAVEAREPTERLLAAQLIECFPQLEGMQVTHRWSGPIATTTRFTFTAGSRRDGRVAWAVGYTGLGIGASRFAASTALDLLDARSTERTRLSMVRRPPVPFPPEPLRFVGIGLTRRALARADRREGRRGPWLRLLDRFGVGFDS